MRLLMLLLVMFVYAASPAIAGPYEDGVAASDRKDYATALRLFRPLADQGDRRAQEMLGLMYQVGAGVPQDYQAAILWYRKSADQGTASAQYLLGEMYAAGRGVPSDFSIAVSWFRRSAEQGDPAAQIALGLAYQLGKGVPKDYVQAHKWYNLAIARMTPTYDSAGTVASRDRVATWMTPAQVAEAQKLAREWKPKPER
jgi:TPR repeat protein